MALTRARVVAGPAALANKVEAIIATTLRHSRDPDQLIIDVDDMRRRIADEHRNPPIWHVKHVRGGMVDIEFIAQYLQLREAAARPETLDVNTIAALKKLAAVGALASELARELAAALTLWRDIQALLKLTAEEPFDEEAATPALKALLAKGAGSADFAALRDHMGVVAHRAFVRYEALVGRPAAEARKRSASQ
jgi:glutamate-ammonia-ligase adenylyltransferase